MYLHIACRSPIWVMWEGAIFYWKAFTNALSWRFEIWKISIGVKDEATVDVLWVCLCIPQSPVVIRLIPLTTLGAMVCYIHIGVRLLRCSFYSNGHSRASNRGTGNWYELSRFFFVSISLGFVIWFPGIKKELFK